VKYLNILIFKHKNMSQTYTISTNSIDYPTIPTMWNKNRVLIKQDIEDTNLCKIKIPHVNFEGNKLIHIQIIPKDYLVLNKF